MSNSAEIITGALNSQLSVARHFGGCEFNGAQYTWRYDAPPEFHGVLLRNDIMLNTAQLKERLTNKENVK